MLNVWTFFFSQFSSLACRNQTHFICLELLCKDETMFARNQTFKLLHRDYRQLAEGKKNENNNHVYVGFFGGEEQFAKKVKKINKKK